MTTGRKSHLNLERDTSAYTVDGKRVVSVTEALKLAGLVDFSGVPEAMLEQAAQRGKMVHAITALSDKGDYPIGMPEECAGYFDAYKDYMREHRPSWTHIEHPVVSARHRFAGTLDRYGVMPVGCKRILLDIKTSASIEPWVGLQLAGYEIALREQLKLPTSMMIDRYSLQLRRDGTYRLRKWTAASDRADFLACVRIANWQLQQGGYEL